MAPGPLSYRDIRETVPRSGILVISLEWLETNLSLKQHIVQHKDRRIEKRSSLKVSFLPLSLQRNVLGELIKI